MENMITEKTSKNGKNISNDIYDSLSAYLRLSGLHYTPIALATYGYRTHLTDNITLIYTLSKSFLEVG